MNKKKWDLVLGFYQNYSITSSVLDRLRTQGFQRSSRIHCTHEGEILIDSPHFSPMWIQFIIALLAVVLGFHFYTTFNLTPNIIWGALWLIISGSIGYFLGSFLTQKMPMGVDPEILATYKEFVIRDEILVLVQVEHHEAGKVMQILREVKTDQPIAFLLRAQHDFPITLQQKNISQEPLTIEQLKEQAAQLAAIYTHVKPQKSRKQPLLQRLEESDLILKEIRRDLSEAENLEQMITISSEWLLDNAYVIQGHIENVQRDLPKKFYHELPELTDGPLAGLPRIYAIAVDLISNSAGRLTRENILAFLESYQTVAPLTIGELWAFPLMLRLRLIESLRDLTIKLDQRLHDGELASFWGNRLIYMSRREPEQLQPLLEDLANQLPNPSPHFAEELLDHLFDEEMILPQVKQWLEEKFLEHIPTVIHQEQLHKSAQQVILANAITSLITLSHLPWPELFELISPVDAILGKDPLNVYFDMSFATRDAYRHVIEIISKRSKATEVEVAQQTLALAKSGQDEVTTHVGYYLIDEGRKVLENLEGYHSPIAEQISRAIKAHASLIYIGTIALFTLLIDYSLIKLALEYEVNPLITYLCAFLALWPISEIVIQVVNTIITMIFPPTVLPKMWFDQGIPQEESTLVIVPMMLLTPDTIRGDLHRLEIRYLANIDSNVRFGLFSDYCDAPKQHMEEDNTLLEIAIKGVEALNTKYGNQSFFLFHRERTWSDCEDAWIGWERKRGKLECLNRFLVGEPIESDNTILRVGKTESLAHIRYVITLDADTQLFKDKARHLIETISHPLNRPRLSEDGREVLRGYTIIQPLVKTDFPYANVSLFTRLFSEATGIDAYIQTVSDVYQDLFSEGTYHGKGIYDVHAFHRVLSTRFPEEHLLSHDLLEGAYVHVGFASDVVLLDLFPENYSTWTKRQHRWMRGDWQIINWLFPHVPGPKDEKQKNPLSAISRWKIFDNLRRALMPPSMILLLLSAWIFSSTAPLWSGLVALTLLTPGIITFVRNPYQALIAWRKLAECFFRALIMAAILPHQAYLAIDALARVIYRRSFTQRHLLEWSTNHHCSNSAYRTFLIKFGSASFFSVLILILVTFISPSNVTLALPFLLLWLISPLLISYLDQTKTQPRSTTISHKDHVMLRQLARKTWRFFDDFVGPQTHWLPPDNYQAALEVEVAQRTSPTNIGLWLMSTMTAYDFKYITNDELIEKCQATLSTLDELEHYEGHLLNWYDIQTLAPLYPRYVSTVDSGNFLASLWTMEQGIDQMLFSPILPLTIFDGLKDTLLLFMHSNRKSSKEIKDKVHLINKIIAESNSKKTDLITIIRSTGSHIGELEQLVEHSNSKNPEQLYWAKKLKQQIDACCALIDLYLPWGDHLRSLSPEQLNSLGPAAHPYIERALNTFPSFRTLAAGPSQELAYFLEISERRQELNLTPGICKWLDGLIAASMIAQKNAENHVQKAKQLIEKMESIADQTNMQFLYNAERRVFAIGYNVDDRRLDSSYYDLLASEARLASFISIAKADVPLEHWWALGRPFTSVNGRRVLLSWGGTMFEYLMPLLFTKSYEGSLLGEACKSAVACQIDYGNKRGIPWGISEAAFSGIDVRKIYQYRSFGVPGMGLKRGLEADLVVSPYSTGLALAVDIQSSVKNLYRLANESEHDLLSAYGYYESIDFARQRGPHGERGVIVYAFMAHHQGMMLVAINNAMHHDIMQTRFHSDPRICGIESILNERAPLHPPMLSNYRPQAMQRLVPISTVAIMGTMDTPHSRAPKVILLSNSNYSIMMTSAGGGYSRWRDFDITRWRADTTCDSWGNFCYIKDMESGAIWSTAYHPTQAKSRLYQVSFKADKADFRRRDNEIETHTEIVVSPEDDAEVWVITLANLSSTTRYLELTSYLELALAPHKADLAHPSFNKLFIETEALPQLSALLAYRRARSPNETPIWTAHLLSKTEEITSLEYETDRNLFIGRGKTLEHPEALDKTLSNSSGYVLDPIFSLRRKVSIEPGQRVILSFVTLSADTREKAIALVEKYHDLSASHRALEMAWTHAHLELRRLRIHQEEMQLYQKLASRILYPHPQFRASNERLRRNRLGQSRLWGHGVSGDLPIVVITVGDNSETDFIKQILTAHSFWTMRGLKTDLIILNEEATGYLHPLGEQIQRLIQAYAHHTEIEKPGGIFLRSTDQIPDDELTLILSVARAVLVAARGSLRQQLVTPIEPANLAPRLIPHRSIQEEPSPRLPFWELPFYNGIGGYSKDGKEYVIYLEAGRHTPAPWVNVIANPQFGTMVSEAGIRCTWFGNSQANRLTTWSNDPILDPSSDAIYIRDEERGTFWSPTPSPVRELDHYRIHHGQGYTTFQHNSHGIQQELTVFVPVDDKGGLPLRVQRLRLTNSSSRPRKLSITAYSDIVMGTDREETQMHIVSEWDCESQSLFAYNRYNPDYSEFVAFSGSFPPATSFTSSRTGFIGRNNSVTAPDAMRRQKLNGMTGAGIDPCMALQIHLEIAPGKTEEVVFILGYATSTDVARQYLAQSNSSAAIEQLLAETRSWWNKTLNTIQVNTNHSATNFALNSWLLYQVLSCRVWGRTAFYQSSGAYGFRDQLQDVMALLYSVPAVAREQILRAASRQFPEGDVQHWWHPPSGAGVRTRISDDLLWLPYVTAHYVRVTGDLSILDEEIPFLQGAVLEEQQHEAYFVPEQSKETASLLEHCRRAIQKGTTAGVHGLPLIGCGDWNDGMNSVGIEGKGESVWLAWFLIQVMTDFGSLLAATGQKEAAENYKLQAKRLAESVEACAWDGEWYRRAYFDNGTPLGSKGNTEAKIDSIAQSWAVICGLANPVRTDLALKSVMRHLVRPEDKLVLLLTPPFNEFPLYPGYIMGYPPGVRENGGQYTHGSLWVPMAFARNGDGDQAVNLLRMMHPFDHTQNLKDLQRYKTEPYVLTGDVYDLPGKVGRGGWSWYSGSAGWMYRIWLEEIFGFTLSNHKELRINPTIPKSWDSVKIIYRYQNTLYEIIITNPHHVSRGVFRTTLDGVAIDNHMIHLTNDEKPHTITIELGAEH